MGKVNLVPLWFASLFRESTKMHSSENQNFVMPQRAKTPPLLGFKHEALPRSLVFWTKCQVSVVI